MRIKFYLGYVSAMILFVGGWIANDFWASLALGAVAVLCMIWAEIGEKYDG